MIAIFPLLILAVLLVGLVLGLIMWLTNNPKSGHGEMACGGCGYSVRGLETLNCPECGADLRRVGIKSGQNGRSRIFGMVLTLSCGGVLLLSCLLSLVFMVGSDSSSSPAIQAVPLQAVPTSPNATTSAPSVLVEDDEGDGVADPPTVDQPAPDGPAPDVPAE